MGTEVGTLKLRADSKDIKRATDDLRALDRQAGKSEKGVGALRKSFIGLAAVAGAGLFARAAIQNTIAQEKAMAQLDAVLKSTGGTAGLARNELVKMAAGFQQVTTFGDEAVLSAESMLLTFKNISSKEFPAATEAVLNVATALNTDLKSAAIQVGKALNDPAIGLTALSRSGITFSESQQKVIKDLQDTGRIAEAQRLILIELESQFGGSARAARDTFGGALEGLKNTLGDLLEGEGSSVVGLKDSINELSATLSSQETKAGFAAMVSGILSVVQHATDAITVLGGLSNIISQKFTKDAEKSLDGLAFKLVDLDDELAKQKNIQKFLDPRGLQGGTNKQIQAIEAEIEATQRLLAEKSKQARIEKLIAGSTFIDLGALPTTIPKTIPSTTSKGDDRAQSEAKRIMDEAISGAETLRETLDNLAAQQNGPSLGAAQQLAGTLVELSVAQQALAAAGQLTADREAQFTVARQAAQDVFDAEIEKINELEAARRAELTPAQEAVELLEFELSLRGLSNTEKQVEIALRRANTTAATTEGQAISELIVALERDAEAAQFFDSLKFASEDALASVLDGSRGIKGALNDLVGNIRSIIAQKISEQLVESLFGSFGGGGGGGGGGFAGLLGGLFGGGRAVGGPTTPGRLHPVTERGEPELLTTGGKQFLIAPDQPGRVDPIRSGGGGGGTTNVTVNLPPQFSPRTAQQTAAETSRALSRATARNG